MQARHERRPGEGPQQLHDLVQRDPGRDGPRRAAGDPVRRQAVLRHFLAVFETVNGGAMVSAFETLMREGAAVGVRVVVTGDRTAFRGRTGMLLEDRLVLRMPAADDYELVGMRARDAPASMPAGRAFRSGPHPREVQVAVLDADPSGSG